MAPDVSPCCSILLDCAATTSGEVDMMNRFEVPITQLSFTQKLDLMETLWSDMSAHEKSLESPAWHEDILNDRAAALSAGTITASNWAEAKERIKKNIA